MLTVDIQSISKATKFLPPKIKKYDHLPAKKPKSGNLNPEVHIALNFAATPGIGPSASAIPSQTIIPCHLALTSGQTHPVRGSDIPVHTVNIIPTPGTGPLYPAADQPSIQSPLPPTPEEMFPAGGSDTLVHAICQKTPPGTIHASQMRIILDCHDVSTVPLVLDLLILMDQDRPTSDQKYVDALSEFYDFGVEDILDIFDMPRRLLASLGDLGNNRAHQLHEYVHDKLLLPLGLLETRLKTEVGGQGVIIKAEGSSIFEGGGHRSVLGAGSNSSIVEITITQTLPQAPMDDNESMEYSVDGEESWPEEDRWVIKDECKERVVEWLAGIWEAGENESESDMSYEV